MFSLAAKEAEECSMLDRPNGPLKQKFMKHLLKIKKAKKIDTFLYQHFRSTGHSCSSRKVLVQPVEKIIHKSNSTERFKNILRHELELKWIKRSQTPFPLGFNDNINHERNIAKMPDFNALSLLDKNKVINDLMVSAKMAILNENIKLSYLFLI